MVRDVGAWCALTGTEARPVMSVWRWTNATLAQTWAALTDPEQLAQWFGDIADADDRKRVVVEEGQEFSARVLHCASPSELELDWSWDEDSHSAVSIRLRTDDGGTLVRLTDTSVDPDALADVGAAWDGVLIALVEHLGEPEQVEAGPEMWTTLENNIVTMKADLDVDRSAVWHALATSEGLGSWWWPDDPGASATIEPFVGGRFRLSAPIVSIAVGGEVIAIEPESVLEVTWCRVDEEGIGHDEAVRFEITDRADGATITVHHAVPYEDDGTRAAGWRTKLAALTTSLVEKPVLHSFSADL